MMPQDSEHSDSPAYTEYHPRWYRRRMPIHWWLERRSYLAFILRELSSVFVAWSVVYLLLLIRAVSQGDSRYEEFVAWSGRPVVLVINAVSLCFIVLHAITWFNLAPQALVVRVLGKRVPGPLIMASNYVAWVLSSAPVVWLVLAA